jgi:hypothetical protein
MLVTVPHLHLIMLLPVVVVVVAEPRAQDYQALLAAVPVQMSQAGLVPLHKVLRVARALVL